MESKKKSRMAGVFAQLFVNETFSLFKAQDDIAEFLDLHSESMAQAKAVFDTF